MDIYQINNPVVSVIMTTFNRSLYLYRSINSFLNQSYRDTELIIVDDGSEDDTFHAADHYVRANHNIRYLRHTNRKTALSKNAGIQAACGRYIAFLDSDDEYKPDYLEKRVEFMRKNPAIDLIEGGTVIIGNPYVIDINNPLKEIHLSSCHIGATFFGKKEVFLSLNGFNKNVTYGDDSDFWERAEKKYNLEKINYAGYIYYRQTPDSICNSMYAK